MPSPYNLDIDEHCMTCRHRKDGVFCDMSTETLAALDAVRFSFNYPKGSILFLEGEQSRGVFILCSGTVKLTTSSSDGRTLITRIAQRGEVLGVSATIAGKAYAVSAETLEPSQVSFIDRDSFLRLLASSAEASMHAAILLSEKDFAAQHQLARSFPHDDRETDAPVP